VELLYTFFFFLYTTEKRERKSGAIEK